MTVSVIVPYLESGALIQKTADSLNRQKKVNTNDIQLLVADATAEQDAEERLSGCSGIKIVSCPGLNEAEAYNKALESLDSEYAVLARPGDVFGSHYFMNALKAVKKHGFAAPMRFCINPVYAHYKYINRTNLNVKYLNSVVDINANPSFLQHEPDGCIIKSEILKKYPADTKLRYEYFHDVMLRLQKDYPTYYAMGEANFNTFMPLSDDSAYFVPSNHIEWYKESIDTFLLPLCEREQLPDGSLPYYIQYYLMFAVSARFLANMNNRNKRNMSEEELEEFFTACKKVLDRIDDTMVLNAGKYKSLGYSEEAAEMFWMLKHDKTLYTMPMHLSEGAEDVVLDCSDVVIARLQGQRVGLHV
ncbi:MAG: hypothetical protein IJU73_00125, partial [Ruminococcus sp.]|nr:hypothetical protein [Ruminococcus sp.]